MLKICTVFLLLLTVSCANFERRLADDLVNQARLSSTAVKSRVLTTPESTAI